MRRGAWAGAFTTRWLMHAVAPLVGMAADVKFGKHVCATLLPVQTVLQDQTRCVLGTVMTVLGRATVQASTMHFNGRCQAAVLLPCTTPLACLMGVQPTLYSQMTSGKWQGAMG